MKVNQQTTKNKNVHKYSGPKNNWFTQKKLTFHLSLSEAEAGAFWHKGGKLRTEL